MRRGEVRLVDLDPARNGDAASMRPAVVVSNDRANAAAVAAGRGLVTVVPLTSSVAQVFAFQVLLPAGVAGLPAASKAQAEQVRSVAVDRLGPALGRVPTQFMNRIDAALRLHLSL